MICVPSAPQPAPPAAVAASLLVPYPYAAQCPPPTRAQLIELAGLWRDVVGARGVTTKYSTERHKHLLAVIDATGGALDDTRVTIAVGQIRTTGKSARTANKHLSAAKSFTRWLAGPSRRYLPFDPLADLSQSNVKRDRRHERTSYTDAQWLALFTAAQASKFVYRGVAGPDRAEVYHVAACTGLRERTLPLVEVGQFDLAGPMGFVTVRAEQLKDAEDLVIPIQAESAARLRRYFAGRMPTAKALRCPPHSWDFIRMLKADLAEAGVRYCRELPTAGGRKRRVDVLDFHALRHTFGTRCASAGIPLTTTQRMMGHSDPSLTANVYSHVLPPDLLDAMRRLPALPGIGLATA